MGVCVRVGEKERKRVTNQVRESQGEREREGVRGRQRQLHA